MTINCSVAICGVVKNCGVRLQTNIKLALDFISHFQTGKVVIYENNSTDGITKQILQNYSNDSRFIIKSEDLPPDTKDTSKIWAYTDVTGSDHPCRIEQICNARNKLMKLLPPDLDYLVMVDMDSLGWSVSACVEAIRSTPDEWDVLYANGVNSTGKVYYDLYALRMEPDHLFGPELLGEKFWNELQYFKIPITHDGRIPVKSAFGGLGIFKKAVIPHIKYDCIVTPEVAQFYSNIANPPIETNTACSKFPGGEMINGLYYKANSGYDRPVVCEHVCLNLALSSRFRIMIEPKLVYVHSG
jgi:hypothetical protein